MACPFNCVNPRLTLAAPGLHAAEKVIRLKLGTLAPAGTSYHKSLQAMGEKWRKASDGAVQLVIFPGGTQGSEADMVGLMQTGNLDAGLLTTGGLVGNRSGCPGHAGDADVLPQPR